MLSTLCSAIYWRQHQQAPDLHYGQLWIHWWFLKKIDLLRILFYFRMEDWRTAGGRLLWCCQILVASCWCYLEMIEIFWNNNQITYFDSRKLQEYFLLTNLSLNIYFEMECINKTSRIVNILQSLSKRFFQNKIVWTSNSVLYWSALENEILLRQQNQCLSLCF